MNTLPTDTFAIESARGLLHSGLPVLRRERERSWIRTQMPAAQGSPSGRPSGDPLRHLSNSALHRGGTAANTLTLRASQAAPSIAVPSCGSSPTACDPMERHQILVVDDNRDAADSLAHLFGVMGAAVSVAYGAKEALKAMTVAQPKMAFIDISMPIMNGYELAAQIRASQAFSGMVLIALTGWGQVAEAAHSVNTGFDHHLMKPASVHALSRLLGSIT